jgi:DNA-binding response OmpR family regulator
MSSALVIEGDVIVARYLAEVFERQGWWASVPGRGQLVVAELLSDKRYDLITVSYRFPGTNGVDLITLIRELEHRRDTPVLMITGDHGVTSEAMRAGGDGCSL